ncbi:glutamate-rich WD repeat-containing protein 1-like [Ornithodoros turicata]|uniref:glutamate-rich WD repeat-containing protein 1-like n=1 Tax=Ornithodoros turicata TaxID=34597 RepID=UPI003139C88A
MADADDSDVGSSISDMEEVGENEAEDEGMSSEGDGEAGDGDHGVEEEAHENVERRVYVPGTNANDEDGELECDESAYVLYHQVTTVAPCLSFDIIPDNLGEKRADKFPLSAYLVSGTQAERSHLNHVIVMKMSNMSRNKASKKANENEDDESDSSDSEDEDDKPELDSALIPHQGCVNRIRVTKHHDKVMAATWSENRKVYLWDLSHPLKAVDNPSVMSLYVRNSEAPKPAFSFAGHLTEGYAMDWSPTKPGVLATGDCTKNIHLWKPQESTWHVDQRAYTAHTASVEDIQWSPNEATVMASCSVDKSIRIWDIRAAPHKACMLTTSDAHETDVNVISWNRTEPFLLSGGDDGAVKVWDLRLFQSGKPVAVFKHHLAPITSVEWHPTDSTVFCASGADDQLTLWDLAVERDRDAEGDAAEEPEVSQLPPQLLFIHQGQKDIKEAHWHRQMPGLVISTAHTGFNVFRTISV